MTSPVDINYKGLRGENCSEPDGCGRSPRRLERCRYRESGRNVVRHFVLNPAFVIAAVYY